PCPTVDAPTARSIPADPRIPRRRRGLPTPRSPRDDTAARPGAAKAEHEEKGESPARRGLASHGATSLLLGGLGGGLLTGLDAGGLPFGLAPRRGRIGIGRGLGGTGLAD